MWALICTLCMWTMAGHIVCSTPVSSAGILNFQTDINATSQSPTHPASQVFAECSPQPLGLADGRIPASNIRVSSQDPSHPKDNLGTDGWCPAANDNTPWVQITLDKPMAVSVFQFGFITRLQSDPDRMYIKQFGLQYIAAVDSTRSLRTFSENIPALNKTHYFTVSTSPVIVTDTIRIIPASHEIRACFKLELQGCDPTTMCTANWCKNNGTCIGQNVCNCPTGYFGTQCDQIPTQIMATQLAFVNITNNVLITAVPSISFAVQGNVNITTIPGKPDPVLTIQGTNSFIQMNVTGTSASCISKIDLCTSGFTFAVDVSFALLLDNTYIVSSGGNMPGHMGVALYYSQNHFYYIVSSSTFTWTLVVTYTPALNVWQHFEITWNPHLGVEILVNGHSLGTNGRPNPSGGSTTLPLCIACSPGQVTVNVNMMVTGIIYWTFDRTVLVNAGIIPARIMCNFQPKGWTSAMQHCLNLRGTPVGIATVWELAGLQLNASFWTADYVSRIKTTYSLVECEYRTLTTGNQISQAKSGNCDEIRHYICCDHNMITQCVKNGTWQEASKCNESYSNITQTEQLPVGDYWRRTAFGYQDYVYTGDKLQSIDQCGIVDVNRNFQFVSDCATLQYSFCEVENYIGSDLSVCGSTIVTKQPSSNAPASSSSGCGPWNSDSSSVNYQTIKYKNATTFGAEAVMTCYSGYHVFNKTNKRSESAICTGNGTWSTPTYSACVHTDCGGWYSDSNSDKHQQIKYKNATTFGSEAVMTCNPGYHVVNKTNTRSESAYCTENGTWSAPTYSACVPIDCGDWHSDNISDNHLAIIYKNATTFGSEAVMTCNPGYHVVNKTNTRSESAVCTENGTWSIPTCSACVLIDCGKWYSDSSLDNHQPIIYKNATTFGSDAEMTCNPGYHVVNKTNTRFESATCTANGTWSTLTYSACVPIECPVLDTYDNLTIELAPNPSKAISNTTATFSCSPGTTLVGFATLTCRITGQWTGPAPKCIVLQESVGNCYIDLDTKQRTWNETQPGRIVEVDCPSGFSGKVSRQCSQEGKWLKPFYNCVSKRVSELISTVERLKESPTAAKITDSLDQLVNVTKPANGTAYIGELNAITDMLDTIASVSVYKEVTHEQANSFFTATSNLLDSDNAESWQSGGDHYGTDVSPDGSNTSTADYGAMKVVNVVDKYTDILMLSLGNESDTSKTIPTDNMVVHVTQINKTAVELKFPNFSSSIILPNTSLIGSHSIGAVLYKSLTGLISSVLKNYSESTINSEVVTVTLDNWENNTDFVVDITMKYAQDLHAPPICSFWNATIFSWDTSGCRVLSSEHSSATCRCAHLTNFAVLMSPIIQSNVNTKDLDIISIVGCSISLAGLGLTVIVHILLWKYVGKRRVAVLLNLSIALIISYVMFIGGIDRTENKIVCTTVASLLHYIYLVVFSLMLVEGIDIAVSILIVFKTTSKLKWMLTAAWVAPAVIVGTTLGVTKTEGYGNELSCWLTIKEGVIWAFVGPALLVVLVNFVILVIVIRATLRTYAMAKKSTVERSKSAVRCLVVLLPLMGLTWVLGVFYLDESMAWVQYAFAVCNSLQGFVIFLFHCAFNKTLWKAYKTKQQRSSYASNTYLKSRSTSVRSMTTEHSEVCMTVHDQSRIPSVDALANTRFGGLPDRKPMQTTEVTDKEEHIDGIVEHFEKSANEETLQSKDDAKSVNTDRNDVGMENKTQQDFYSEVL